MQAALAPTAMHTFTVDGGGPRSCGAKHLHHGRAAREHSDSPPRQARAGIREARLELAEKLPELRSAHARTSLAVSIASSGFPE